MLDDGKITKSAYDTAVTEQIVLNRPQTKKNDYVETYTQRELDYSLTLLAERITIILLNRMNSEGISSESFNGTSVSYIDGLPDDIIKALNKKRKVILK